MRPIYATLFISLFLSLFVGILPAQVQSGAATQIKRVPGGSLPVAPEKEVGDEVIVRPDGTIFCASRGHTFTYLATNRLEPKAAVSYSLIAGRLQYQLRFANGAGALGAIGLIRIGMPPPPDLILPAPWKVITNPVATGSQFGLMRIARDGDPVGRLIPGFSLGPITFTSDGAPGLVDITVYPEPDLGVAKPGELTNGEFFNQASPWVQQQISQMDTQDRHIVRAAMIGPVTPLASDSTLLIASELSNAVAQRAELAHLQGGLQVPLSDEKNQLAARILKMRQQSAAGLASDFLDALSWRLQQLR